MEYPAIRKLAPREGAEIHWLDETGLPSDQQAGTFCGDRVRKRPRTKLQLVGHVRRFLWSTQRQPQRVRQ